MKRSSSYPWRDHGKEKEKEKKRSTVIGIMFGRKKKGRTSRQILGSNIFTVDNFFFPDYGS